MDFGILTSLVLKLEGITIELSKHQHMQIVDVLPTNATHHYFTITHRGHGRANAGVSALRVFVCVSPSLYSQSRHLYVAARLLPRTGACSIPQIGKFVLFAFVSYMARITS